MAYTSGLLKDRVTILNRKEAVQGKFGLDSAGIEWKNAGTVWASVDWAKGKGAMNAGALDVYGVVMIRMRYNSIVNERSLIRWHGKAYQIVGGTFHPDRQANTIQMNAVELADQQVNIVPPPSTGLSSTRFCNETERTMKQAIATIRFNTRRGEAE